MSDEIKMPKIGWLAMGREPSRFRRRAHQRWEDECRFYATIWDWFYSASESGEQ
jgi:hypothetical protein